MTWASAGVCRCGRHRGHPPFGPDRRADPARAAAGHPPGQGSQVRHAGSATARQCGLGRWPEIRFLLGYVADHAGVAEADVLAADLMTHDLTPSAVIGPRTASLLRPPAGQRGQPLCGMEALWTRRRVTSCPCW